MGLGPTVTVDGTVVETILGGDFRYVFFFDRKMSLLNLDHFFNIYDFFFTVSL